MNQTVKILGFAGHAASPTIIFSCSNRIAAKSRPMDSVDGPSNSILHSNCLFYFKQTFLVNDELRRVHGLWPSALHPCIGPEGGSIF